MSTITPDKTISELVTEFPGRSRVFEEMGIDYCCGGKKALSAVCSERGIDVNDIIRRLDATKPEPGIADEKDYTTMRLGELADHIVDTHHAYLKRELPRLMQMAQRVAKVHGGSDVRLIEVNDVLAGLVSEMNAHMMKEEMILFPAIKMIEASKTMPILPFGSIANPIRAMEFEHDSAGSGLSQMNVLTDGYAPPDWACNTYRALLDGLHVLESDMHQHIHKENNVLFPRVIETERGLGANN